MAMLKFRLFFASFFLLFGITSYLTSPFANSLNYHAAPWWQVVGFLFSSLFALSFLNALVGTFFGMKTTSDGKVCIPKRHLLYRWVDGCFDLLFALARTFVPKRMKNARWSGVISGCNLGWCLIPLVIVEFVVIMGIFEVGFFFYELFIGNISGQIILQGLVPIASLVTLFTLFMLAVTATRKWLSRAAGCLLAISLLAVISYGLIGKIMELGFFAALSSGLMLLGETLLFFVSVLGALTIATWIVSYIYLNIPFLRTTAFGQLVIGLKKGICPVAEPCPEDESNESVAAGNGT